MATSRITTSFLIALVAGACSAVSPRGGSAAPPTASNSGNMPTNSIPLATPLVNPKIVIVKSKRSLKLYSNDVVVKTYRIGLGLSPVDDKARQGDRRTPEGDFYVCIKNSRSQFYLSLGLSYPNRAHAERGVRDRLISRGQYDQIVGALNRRRLPLQNTRLGGEIFIHGGGSTSDWTWGCVALDNRDIKELFDAVPVGTPVTIEH